MAAAISIGREGRVWAVEPHPRTFGFLVANLQLNSVDNVTALNCAAGEASRTIALTDNRRDDMNRVGDGPLTVRVEPLDELVMCDKTIALLKVDVEGYERLVFEGARVILANTQCLHFELGRRHLSWFGYDSRDLLQLVESFGFKLYRIVSSRYLKAIDTDYNTELVENVIGVRQPSEFEERTGWKVLQ